MSRISNEYKGNAFNVLSYLIFFAASKEKQTYHLFERVRANVHLFLWKQKGFKVSPNPNPNPVLVGTCYNYIVPILIPSIDYVILFKIHQILILRVLDGL